MKEIERWGERDRNRNQFKGRSSYLYKRSSVLIGSQIESCHAVADSCSSNHILPVTT